MPIVPVKALVAAAKAVIETISPADALARAEAGEALLVDIRDVRELDREGRIPGAFHAPRGMLEFWIDPDSPYHKPALATEQTLVLFCAGAWRSALSARTAQEMGLEKVSHITDGFSGWKAAGGPVGERPARKG